MAQDFEQTAADELGKQHSNTEMNPAANSSITDDGLLESDKKEGDTSWRDSVDDESDIHGDIENAADKA